MVAGAVADEAGQPERPGWDPVEAVAAWERELVAKDLEPEPSFVECGSVV